MPLYSDHVKHYFNSATSIPSISQELKNEIKVAGLYKGQEKLSNHHLYNILNI